MAEDDIYGNKARYEGFIARLQTLTLDPNLRKRDGRGKRGKYRCRNPENLKHFRTLHTIFQARDTSYIRRTRLLQSLTFISDHTTKYLPELTREDINEIMASMHDAYKAPKSKETFIRDTRHIWKTLFPETDIHGRPDDTITPYPVRHLSARIDKSRQKMRRDKLTQTEIDQLIQYFNKDPRIQAYITLALESLARPQEILYLKIGNTELHDNHAIIWLTEHGKEGTGLLQCIDSYPYLLKWLSQHPNATNKNAPLFLNTGNTNTLKKMRPENINKMLHTACKVLGIDKPITCYSLKRNGVTMRRLNGQTDMEIQHAARWTSTKHLQTYDLSNQTEALNRELQKRGLAPTNPTSPPQTNKKCLYCQATNGKTETICTQCKRPLDRTAIIQETQKKEHEVQQLQTQITTLNQQLQTAKTQILQEIMNTITQNKTNKPNKPNKHKHHNHGKNWKNQKSNGTVAVNTKELNNSQPLNTSMPRCR